MSSLKLSLTYVSLLVFVLFGFSFSQEISDPYEILNRHFETLGGLDKLKAEITSYAEGNISIGGMGGTLKAWNEITGKSRVELTIGPLNITQGDNGEYMWVIDQNGKLQKMTNMDEATLKRRQVSLLLDTYEFMKPESDVFEISLAEDESVDSKDCYSVKITNNINFDSYTIYINKETFLNEKAVYIEDDQSRDVFYDDFRDVDGIKIPFHVKEVAHQTGQSQETILTKYISNPEISPDKYEHPNEESQDYTFTNGNSSENIPFKFIADHIFLFVNVSGKERIWVLDTGAGVSVINKKFAEDLGLEMEGELKGSGSGGTVTARFATLPSYSLKGIEFDEQIVAVIDMDELIRRVGIDFVGVLGFDFLSRFVTKVDFANELISFYEPETFKYNGDGHQVDIHIEESLFEVEATLDGIHTGSWLIDLGAGTSHLDGAYAVSEGYAARPGLISVGHGAANEFRLKKIVCDSIKFADYTIFDQEITFNDVESDTTFTADQLGILGNSLFQHFVLYCDYSRENLIVEKGDKFNIPRPRDKSGLKIAWDKERNVKVIFVSPDTPGKKAGFEKGDIIKSINGIDIKLLDGLYAVREMFLKDPGTKYDFVIDRNGKEKNLKLKLAKIL